MEVGYDKHKAEQRTMRLAIFAAAVVVLGIGLLMYAGSNTPVFLNYLLGYPSPASARIGDRAGGAPSGVTGQQPPAGSGDERTK